MHQHARSPIHDVPSRSRGLLLPAALLLFLLWLRPAGAQEIRWSQQCKLPDQPGLSWHSFRSESMDVDVGYTIYLPPGYDDPANAARRYPSIYFLHGGNGSECNYHNTMGKSPHSIVSLVASGAIPPTILVFPNGGRGEFLGYRDWPGDCAETKRCAETVIFEELIPHVDATYRTIPDGRKRGLWGFSLGGYGTWRGGLVHADQFCALVPLAVGAIDLAGGWGEVEQLLGIAPADPARQGALARSLWVKVAVGEGDRREFVDFPARFAGALGMIGVPAARVEAAVVPGVRHNLRQMLEAPDPAAPGQSVGQRIADFHWACFNDSGEAAPERGGGKRWVPHCPPAGTPKLPKGGPGSCGAGD